MQQKDKLKAGLIGVGGRGSGAIVDCLTGNPNVEIVALADVFEDHLERNLKRLQEKFPDRIKVDAEHRFVGFDAYKKLVNSDVDIVMLCTPPGHRPAHFEAAVEAKKHVFCEKPIATDPVGVRRFMAAAKKAEQLKLTVVCGAQRHYSSEYAETVKKIQDGAIGEIVALYSQYLSGPVWHERERRPQWGDMEYEHRNWYSYNWICGDQIVEQHFHNIDFMNWVMGTHPVKVVAFGGAAWRKDDPMYGDIYDHMTSDFVYPNGVRLSSHCRQYEQGCYRKVDDLIVGTKGRSNGQDMGTKGINSQVQEHIAMVKSILGEGPYINQGMAVAESTMTCIMARESAYSGMEITWDMIMNSKLDLQPKEFDYNLKTPERKRPVPGEYKFI
ncbi:MAG TPA: Gfo/Idh/MocA family oxidoreductase [Bryobacteraceae bacterium]|nr:Gfo/Idh/MocA family oxidoreductase [Bryobacteraceae bacterium]HOQ45304.1 Gfo/Idh/MocA family oxidoreductase [Bryobacteraceae bacterium]HPQ13631.1 Gfo/Idh/MocA family oxidoreductase [Bryobacteraceae bacterium]HPU71384.1 Gfo/Idh/MocA family oxidoreductase [Bryobacteraceae bacterium]